MAKQERSRVAAAPQHAPWENRLIFWHTTARQRPLTKLGGAQGFGVSKWWWWALVSAVPLSRASQLTPAQHSTHVPGTVPPDKQRYPQPAQPLSNIYGNMFCAALEILGLWPWSPFVSVKYVLLNPFWNLIYSQQLLNPADTPPRWRSPPIHGVSLPLPLLSPMSPCPPGPSPGVAPAQQVSLWIPGGLSSCLSTL